MQSRELGLDEIVAEAGTESAEGERHIRGAPDAFVRPPERVLPTSAVLIVLY